MKKRVGSILLCLCIVLTQLPVRVWAVEGVPPFPETEMGETSAPPAPKEEPACTCGAEPGEDGLTVHLPECPLYEESEAPAEGEEPEPLEAPAIFDTIYDEMEGSMVLTVEGDWDSYAWESCIYGAWSDWPGDGPSLTLSKEEFVTRAYRCTVTRGEQSVTSQVFAYDSAALEPPGYSLMASGDLSAENDYMWYGPSQSQFSYPHLFDIQGRDNGSEIRTTYADTGYRTAIEVDGSKVDVRYQEGATTVAGSLTAETDLSFAYGGRYVKITYTVTNNGSTTQDFQIGSSADVMIGNNDHAEVVGTENGLSMNGLPQNGYQFQLVAPDCHTLWYGHFSQAYDNTFTNLENRTTPYNRDSGMAWSWSGAVAPGETWTRYVLVGVGELPPSPDAPTLDNIDTTWPIGATVTVSGTVTGENAADTVYVNFNGTEYSSPVDNEGKFSVNVQVPTDTPEGKSSFTYWSGTDEGGISKIQSQEVTIVAMPQLTLTTHSVTVMEDEELAPDWLRSFIQSSAGTVTTDPLIIDTGKLGDTIVTYTASNEGFADATATLTVTVLPQPAALGLTTVSGPEDGPYTLTATMEYTGGNTWTETGFVYGVIPNPTLSLCDGSVQTTSPVSTKGEKLTATVDADSLAYGFLCYARAYAKTADGTVVYGGQSDGFGPGAPDYGTFSVTNDDGDNTFTITRTGGSDGMQTVYYRTVNGSAIGGTHFTHAAGSVDFAPGETQKTVTVEGENATATYGGNTATAYSNADRVYFLEIYHVTGGATIEDGKDKAERTLTVTEDHRIPDDLYNEKTSEPQGEETRGDYDQDNLGWSDNGQIGNNATETVTIDRTYVNYWAETADNVALHYWVTFDAWEDQDGYQAIQILAGETLDTGLAPESGGWKGNINNTSVQYAAIWEHGEGKKLSTPASYRFPAYEGVSELNERYHDGQQRTNYVTFPADTTHITTGLGASGSGHDRWKTANLVHHYQIVDTQEPELIGIAPMAGGVYRQGDEITISLIFNEIVDGSNSTGLSSATVLTTDGGTLHYSGGADTNVLYFTGTVANANDGKIEVQADSVTALLGIVKDMCENGTPSSAGGGSFSTDIKLSGSAADPTATVSPITNTNGNLSATVSSTNAAKLEYAWSDKSDQNQVTGWTIVQSGATVTAARTSGTWYLHARATSASGETAYAYSFIDLGTEGSVIVPTLTATVDNTGWAQSRDITLTKNSAAAPVTVSGPGITGSETVTGTSYTATANGVYTFKLTYNGQTITQMVTVSNIDIAAPTVTVQDLTNTSHTQAVTLTVAASDGQSGIQTVTGAWSNGSDIRTDVLTANGDGTYTTTSPDASGDWKLTVTATDKAGNSGSDTSASYTINATRPVLTVRETSSSQQGVEYSYSVDPNNNTGITVSLPDGSTTSELSGTFTITEPGTYTISVTDDAGHFVSETVTVPEGGTLDGVAPDVRLRIASEAWAKDAVTVTVSVYDAGSAGEPPTAHLGGQAITLTESSEEPGSFTGSFTVSANGTYTVTCTDAATNTGRGEITIANIDTAVPGIEVSGNPADWTADAVTVTLTVTDGQSGVDSVTVNKDGGGVPVSGSDGTYTFTATENGVYTVTATDAAGNSASETVEITRIDRNTPTISVTSGDTSAASLVLTVTAANDGGSGVTVTVAKDGGEPREVEGGAYTVTAPGAYTFTAATGAGLTAAETVTVYQVTFASAYGVAPSAVLVQSGGTISEPDAPTCAGCTFAGWYQDSADTVFDFNTPITENLTLTAHWTLDSFGVQITGGTRGTYNGGEPVVTLTANTSHAAGDGVIYTYQWYKKNAGGAGTPVGTNSATLTLADVADSGSYYVTVTAGGGILTGQQSASSDPVTVTIGPRPLTVTWSGLKQTFGSFDRTSVAANLDGVAEGDVCNVTYTFRPANPVNAGTYEVTAALTGADAGNYTLTDEDATLTIEKQTVYFTVAGNTVQAGTEPNVTVTPSEQGAAGSYTVTYRYEQNGQTVSSPTPPAESGQYEIWVTFDKDGNYQAPGGLEQQVGTLTVTERPPVTCTVTFAGGGGSAVDAPDPLTAVSGSTVALPANPFTYSGHHFIGWSDGSRLWQPGDLYPVTRDVTLTAQWRAVYEISGIVQQEPTGNGEPEPVPAVVTLMYGGRQVAQTTVDTDGGFSFQELVSGVYNLVTTYGQQIVTTMVTITNASTELDITLPAGNTNSVVEVEDVPVAAVGNLDTVFIDEAANEVYTEDDKSIVSGGGTVEITLTASRPRDDQQEEVAKLEQAAGSAGVGLTVDLTVTKTTIQPGQDTQTETISDTGVVLVTRITLPAELQGWDNYTVYRIHGDDDPTPMSRTADANGEFFEVDGDTLIIHARKYSLYAVSAWDGAPSDGGGSSGDGSSEGDSSGDGSGGGSSGGGTAAWRPVVTEPEHGEVTVSPSRPGRGDTVTITVTPDEGYEVDEVIVTDRNGNPVEVIDNGDGTWSFVQPAGGVTVTVTFREIGGASDCPRDETCPMYDFTDLNMAAWYHDGIHYCLEHGLMVGVGAGQFAPNGTTTRAQLVTILWRLEGKPAGDGRVAFADVPEDAWYAEAVRWAAGEGIAVGYGDGTFGPGDPVLREQLAVMLYRYARYEGCDMSVGEDTNILSYVDFADLSEYAIPAMQWACGTGIVNGIGGGALAPHSTATRAQAAAMLQKFCQR